MGYYETDEQVANYVEMSEGYDGSALIAELAKRLKPGATVLELGMGAGKDLDLLKSAGLDPTGSDRSEAFLRHYRQGGATHPVLQLDAITIDTEHRFDAVYSNKVLHHLSVEQLRTSLARQVEVLNPGGVLMHSFWAGEGSEIFSGMLVSYYRQETLRMQVPDRLEELAIERYTEMDSDDSLWGMWRLAAKA